MAAFESWGNKYCIVHIDMISGVRYSFKDHAMEISVNKVASPDLPKAEVTIHGLSLDEMSEITSVTFKKNAQTPNKLIVEAGYTENDMTKIFSGEITTAFGDFNSSPDVVFKVNAQSGIYPKVKPESPITIKGEMKTEDIVKQVAESNGYNTEFINKDLGSLKDQILTGTPLEKVQKVGKTVGADVIVDNETIVMLPKGEARIQQGIHVINKDNGLIGYPNFTEEGIEFTCFFNPKLCVGGLIQVQSIVPRASGKWKITALTHSLTVNSSSGAEWRTEVTAVYTG